MKTVSNQYTARLVESSVISDYDGGEDLYLVCTNCGKIHPLRTSKEKQRKHLSECAEIKSPYHWTITHTKNQMYHPLEEYELCCNSRLILCIAEINLAYSWDPRDLNKWQCSPFELVTDEYRFKYDFTNFILSELKALQNQVQGELDPIKSLSDDLDRATPYLDAATKKAYALALTTCESGLRSAVEALSAVKSGPTRLAPTIH